MFNSSPREHHSKSVLLPVPMLPGQGLGGDGAGATGIGWGSEDFGDGNGDPAKQKRAKGHKEQSERAAPQRHA